MFGPSRFVELWRRVYFSRYQPVTPFYADLWTTDGTADGTTRIVGSEVRNMRVHNGALFFTSNQRLYRSDGTTGGTVQVSPPSLLTQAGNNLFVVVDNGTDDKELWMVPIGR